jgi:hypothetical protein
MQSQPAFWQRWGRFETIWRTIVAVSVAIIAWMSVLTQARDRQRSLDEAARDGTQLVRNSRATADSARRTNSAQAAAALMPFLVRGTRAERERALRYMLQISPPLVLDATTVLMKIASEPGEREFAKQINAEASVREDQNIFYGHLRVARDLYSKRLDAAACEEYLLTWNSLPAGRDEELVDNEKAWNGVFHCYSQPRDIPRGASDMHQAFKSVTTEAR